MYVYYEKFPVIYNNGIPQTPKITEVVLSSDGKTDNIQWKNNIEKTYANFITKLFKQIPLENRTYDEKSHIWTFIDYYGEKVISLLDTAKIQGLLAGIYIIEITELQERHSRGRLDVAPVNIQAEIKYTEEEFFYSPPASSNEITGEQLYARLAELLSISSDRLKNANDFELKKFKRQAALQYHPDRNNGDSSKMAEFNMLWGIFTAK